MVLTLQQPEMRVAAKTQEAGTAVADVQELIVSCNKDGMESLRRGQLKAAFEQFKYAEAMLLASQTEGENTALLAVTCNNLGCYYKKVGKFHGALSYFRRSLKIEVELQTDEVTLAGTHLNLCAILSKLEKHDKAVQHALCALELMTKRVTEAVEVVSQDDYAILAIAYHNVAWEREFLQQWDQAATAFQTGYQVAKLLLGENHPLSITLGKNCEAVLMKAKNTKVKPGQKRNSVRMEATKEEGGLQLPAVPQSSSLKLPESPRMARSSVRAEALDWVKNEESLWVSFAQKTLRGSGHPAEAEHLAEEHSLESLCEEPSFKPQPLTAQTLKELQELGLSVPKSYDMATFRFAERPQKLLKRTPLGQALDDHPQALMDIIDAEGEGHSSIKCGPSDLRPNRAMNRSTRTSRVVRRTGVFNSTTHRDRVEADLVRRRANQAVPWKSSRAQKLAAERIQRVWRSWYQYCQANSEWMTVTWICATMIQSHWRSYHVRRQRLDTHARVIQRHCRGFLVRIVLKSHRAAVAIQRRVMGMLTRMKLRKLHEAAKQIQRLIRGRLARRRFAKLRQFKQGVAVAIQKYLKAFLARRRVAKLREEKRVKDTLLKAAVDLQRFFRGWKGRQRAQTRHREYLEAKLKHDSAVKIQSLVRGGKAKKRVENLRDQRVQEMEKAATFVRKVWLGAKLRKKYKNLREEYAHAEDRIVVIQRYMRGCICRVRLWKDAVRTEEQLWAVIEIQRIWRGYCGRVRWESEYERVWCREISAALIQRNARGWMARVRVSRTRRRLARAEFERARHRFRAAQRIQALVRGVLTRIITNQRRACVLRAAAQIQRVARGRALRLRLWQQVATQRATVIAAVARGFLVRKRMRQLISKVIVIQRAYRRWLRRPVADRALRQAHAARRDLEAGKIQKQLRQFVERRKIRRIQGAAISAC